MSLRAGGGEGGTVTSEVGGGLFLLAPPPPLRPPLLLPAPRLTEAPGDPGTRARPDDGLIGSTVEVKVKDTRSDYQIFS